jgi:biotin transporter BioY
MEKQNMSLGTVVMWIVVIAVIMIVAGVGLVYLGAVAKVMPTGLGLFSTLPDLVQAIIWIAVLAVIGIGAWFFYPKEKLGDEEARQH